MNHILACASLLAIAAASPAMAQSAPAAPTGQPALEEIIVTAQKRSENLQNVPISVVAVTPVQLVNSGVTNIQGLAALVPGVQLLQGAATANPYIRGVGSQQVGPGLESPVAIYVDGVYYASNFGVPANLTNVAQVEVLKGPQGTLFGRNATGGLINITTRTPTDTPHLEANASYGNYNTTRFEVYATSKIVNNLAADISAMLGNQYDGYGKNLNNGADLYRTSLDLNLRPNGCSPPPAPRR